jgi:hypothetical protein
MNSSYSWKTFPNRLNMFNLTLGRIALFISFLFIGLSGYGQVGIGDISKIPTATLHVFGNQKLQICPPSDTLSDVMVWNRGTNELQRIDGGDGPRGNNYTIKWDARNNRWIFGPIGLSVESIDTTIFQIDTVTNKLELKDGTRPGSTLYWNGTSWVIIGADSMIFNHLRGVRGIVIGRDTANDATTIGLPLGDTTNRCLIWNDTTKVWEPSDCIGGGELPTTGCQNGDILVWDATARRWVCSANRQGWRLEGNRGTNPRVDFLGTLDNRAFVLRTNNIERARFTGDGRFAVGTVAPQDNNRFTVEGTPTDVAAAYISSTSNAPESAALVAESNGGSSILATSYATAPDASAISALAAGTTGQNTGIFGQTNGNAGSMGVLGRAESSNAAGPTFGVVGTTNNGIAFGAGVQGFSRTGTTSGVSGISESNAPGSRGVNGVISPSSPQRNGRYFGVYGNAETQSNVEANGFGVYGTGKIGVFGHMKPEFASQAGTSAAAIYGDGWLVASAKQFRIDHPLDPANKVLNHVCPESNEALNIYSGNITTNGQGEATVQLPAYFEAINKDFRYTLTPIGQFSQAIVQQKVANNRFVIKTDKPNVEVSWMITAVRNDLFIQRYPVQAEVEKAPHERGKYLRPELFGKPADQGLFHVPAENVKPTLEMLRNINGKKISARTPAKTPIAK